MNRRGRGGVCATALGVALSLLFACGGQTGTQTGDPKRNVVGANGLKGPDDFAGIEDAAERSRALFSEASRVMMHPRCVNCHSVERPRQGSDHHLHVPPVFGGEDGKGLPAMRCRGCHQEQNFVFAEIPGAPNWHLAPASMEWIGKSAGYICEQLKDPKRNGGRSLDDIVHHVNHDPLVAWGWDPGPGREPAPGNAATLSALLAEWANTGAECPKE